MQDFIPEDVKSFLLEKIDSIAELEALLFLREHRNQRWTSEAVAARIYTSEEVTANLLKRLAGHGLVAADETSSIVFYYHPLNPELAQLVDHLAKVYARYLVPVTVLVHKKSLRNIEGFADAFKFKKDKEDK